MLGGGPNNNNRAAFFFSIPSSLEEGCPRERAGWYSVLSFRHPQGRIPEEGS
jgi:hypothetical protein